MTGRKRCRGGSDKESSRERSRISYTRIDFEFLNFNVQTGFCGFHEQNAEIEPVLCGWSDDASGIDRYHVEVYLMAVHGGTGNLEEIGAPVHTENIRPPHNSFRYTCQISGVYSIQLTVYDQANNSARARQIFSYDAVSKMTSMWCAVAVYRQWRNDPERNTHSTRNNAMYDIIDVSKKIHVTCKIESDGNILVC